MYSLYDQGRRYRLGVPSPALVLARPELWQAGRLAPDRADGLEVLELHVEDDGDLGVGHLEPHLVGLAQDPGDALVVLDHDRAARRSLVTADRDAPVPQVLDVPSQDRPHVVERENRGHFVWQP